MHISAYIVAGLAIAAVPFCMSDQIDSGISSLAGTTTVTLTVTPIQGSPAPGPPDSADPRNEWTGGPQGTGTFAVGTRPRDGLAAIPPGRYEVRVAPGAEGGDWMVCDSALCGPSFEANATVVGHAVAPYPSAMYIGPTARTLWIDNVILSPSSSGM